MISIPIKKRSNAPGNGILNQLKKSCRTIDGVENLLLINASNHFQTDEEIMNKVINNFSNCCSKHTNCLINLFKNANDSVDWKELILLYRKCIDEYKGMCEVEKKDFESKKVSQSVVDTRNERNYFIWKLASEWKVCIQTFRLVSISIS